MTETMTHDEVELRKMSDRQLIAYHNILVAGKRMIQVTDGDGKMDRHLEIVNRLLGVSPENALKRLGPPPKQFKVVAISSNRNSFGLLSMILVAHDGEVWTVAANDLNVKKQREIITVPYRGDDLAWEGFGFEIPHRRPQCPPEMLAEIWK